MGAVPRMTAELDFQATWSVRELLKTPAAERDGAWRARFYAAVVDACLAGNSERFILMGPDGMPYAALSVPEENQEIEAFSLRRLLETATNGGFGIAINPHGESVDWVFSYGDLVAFREYGSFEPEISYGDQELRPVVAGAGARLLIGTPSETLFPSYARNVVRSFMQRVLHIEEPRVGLVSIDGRNPELMFNVDRRNFESDDAFREGFNLLAWFMPRGQSVLGLPPEMLDGTIGRQLAPL